MHSPHPFRAQQLAEFVRMVSTAANERVTEEKKATMTPEHVIAALEALEFDYMKEAMADFTKSWESKKAGRSACCSELARFFLLGFALLLSDKVICMLYESSSISWVVNRLTQATGYTSCWLDC